MNVVIYYYTRGVNSYNLIISLGNFHLKLRLVTYRGFIRRVGHAHVNYVTQFKMFEPVQNRFEDI